MGKRDWVLYQGEAGEPEEGEKVTESERGSVRASESESMRAKDEHRTSNFQLRYIASRHPTSNGRRMAKTKSIHDSRFTIHAPTLSRFHAPTSFQPHEFRIP